MIAPLLGRALRAYIAAMIGVFCCAGFAKAAHFTRGAETASKFGVHEITLTGDGSVANPFDTLATVIFTPPSGAARARAVHAFHDGADTWRARVYVDEVGAWTWASACATDAGLDAKAGAFTAAASVLRGKLTRHPANPKAWATDDSAWFLNVSDTGYYLFNSASAAWQAFVRDDASRGVTSIRANLVGALRQFGKQQPSDGWDRIFDDAARTRINVSAFQLQDERMGWMLNEHPGMYLQLIATPEPGQGDDQVWHAFSAAQRERFLRHVVARYAAWPQVFWLVTNDAFVSNHPRNVAMIREIGAYLAAHDPWAEKNLRSSGQRRDTGFAFGAEGWVNYIHLETTYDLAAAQEDPHAAAPMHVYNGEDWYEEEKPITHDAYFFRRLFWAYTLSGGSACYGGAWNRIVAYAGSGFAGLDSAPHLGRFFAHNGIDLSIYQEDDARVSGPSGQRRCKTMRTSDSSRFVVYHPNAGADNYQTALAAGTAKFTVAGLPAGAYSLRWMRAADGVFFDAADMAHAGGNLVCTAPWAGQDVVAFLRLQGDPSSDPGPDPNPDPDPDPDEGVVAWYRFDESAGASDPGNPFVNSGAGGAALDLTNTGGPDGRDNIGGGGYGAPALPGRGFAFDVRASGDGSYHSGAGGSPTGGGALTAAPVPQSALQGADGAFTYEAFVKLSEIATEQTILGHDGSTVRGFLFRIVGGKLSLYTGAVVVDAAIPTSGAHGFVVGDWFHVAVAYDGREGIADNLRFYWTALGAPVAAANPVGEATLGADLVAGASNHLGVGTTTRSPFRFEFGGLIDELIISRRALAADAFRFVTPPVVVADADGLPDAWEIAHGLDPAVDNHLGDPDGDGVPNLLEFALGLDPNSAGRDGLPFVMVEDGFLTLTVVRDPDAAAVLSFVVEASSDLAAWSDDPSEVVVMDDSPALLRARDARTFGEAPRRFLRLRVERPAESAR